MKFALSVLFVLLVAVGLHILREHVPDAGGWILLVALSGVYFAPTITAANAGSRFLLPIFVLNLFLGWTFIGWFVALIWAVTSERRYYGYSHY